MPTSMQVPWPVSIPRLEAPALREPQEVAQASQGCEELSCALSL